MTFTIGLSKAVKQTPLDNDEILADEMFGEDDDNLVSVSIYGTQALKQAGYAFIVEGFGQNPWPVDIDYDGAIVIEQLPSLLSGLAAGRDVTIDFPGQGIERKIDVRHADTNHCQLSCSSMTSWQPSPAQESIERSELVRLLTHLGIDFCRNLQRLDNRWANLNSLKGWETGHIREHLA